MTRHLAKRTFHVDERTRLPSYEEMDYIDWNLFLSDVLGVRIYRVEANTRMRLLISKDGLSRSEAVEALKAMNDLQRGFNTGFPMLTEALTAQRDKKK